MPSAIFFSGRSIEFSKAVYHKAKFQTPPPPHLRRDIERVLLAQYFPGWTLEYIDSLDPFTRAAIWGVIDGQRKVEESRR